MTSALSSGSGRWIVAVTVAGSSMAFLDSTVLSIAMPDIGRDLGADTSSLQWVTTGYLLSLVALILVGGALGDTYGRRRVFEVGVVVFCAASVLCAVAPDTGLLIAARVVQGGGAALLTPGSLAIIQASIRPGDRARAIGAWSGLTGVAAAIGPLVGGVLIAAVSWRAIFLLNLPIGLFTFLAGRRHVPETSDPDAVRGVDVLGAALAAVGLAGVTFWLTGGVGAEGLATAAGVAGVVALAAFLVVESRVPAPMLPLGMFRSRQFSAGNAVTFLVYAAVGGFFFLFASFLQISLGYSPVEAGAASLPETILMLLLSARSGALSERIGVRIPLTVGPVVVGVGLLMLSRVVPGDRYLTHILPGVLVVAIGLVILVAPITATVLAAAGDEHAGVGSGINNAVARMGGLLAVAVLPGLTGLTGDDFYVPSAMTDGFRQSMVICAALSAAGGVLAWLTIRDRRAAPTPEPVEGFCCPVAAPPLRQATSKTS
ncbi:MFS transporter [Dermatobacter hominis]|uniref:MFS transporter n=1 Tax=Dermatobacter hominis TaxID=2884263 RepID=UPI001D115CD0|nr:MFS transporter [Dermatobacter hominis]UDY34308.1 MFS transporter [Dermatobacter hominis]